MPWLVIPAQAGIQQRRCRVFGVRWSVRPVAI